MIALKRCVRAAFPHHFPLFLIIIHSLSFFRLLRLLLYTALLSPSSSSSFFLSCFFLVNIAPGSHHTVSVRRNLSGQPYQSSLEYQQLCCAIFKDRSHQLKSTTLIACKGSFNPRNLSLSLSASPSASATSSLSYLSICLFVCLSVCPPVSLPVCLFVSISLSLSLAPSLF